MKSFKYIARDLTGTRREGFMKGGSSTDVINWLREKSLTPVQVSEMSSDVEKPCRIVQRKRVKSSELAALCWQLTTMVEGGIGITAALEIVNEDIENQQLSHILTTIFEKMNKGVTFSDSLGEFPSVFNKLSCSIILAGETGGNLAGALKRLAEYFDNRDKMVKRVKGAMTYPIFVFVFIVLIVGFISAFIVPRFRTIFEQIGQELPAFTQGFMDVNEFLCSNILYIIGSSTFIIVSLSLFFKRTSFGHQLFSRMVLSMPLFGKLISQSFIVVFCKTMSTLLNSGVSMLEVFDILLSMTNNDVIVDAIRRAKDDITAGANVSEGMAKTSFFPNMVIKMIQVGETSGSMPKVLDRTSIYYERKVESLITSLMGLLEPVLIVVVGAIVLTVVMALYLPIFTMNG